MGDMGKSMLWDLSSKSIEDSGHLAGHAYIPPKDPFCLG